jgi:hypothetical protein
VFKAIFGSRKKGAGRGRRSKYAPAASDVGLRRFLPVTWQHWYGFILFSLVGAAVAADGVRAIIQGRGADPIAAFGVLVLILFVIYKFGTTRVTDNPEGSTPS